MARSLRSEILFLAMTRPSLIWGVPLEGLAANVAVTFFAGLQFQGATVWRSPFMFWAIGVPVHFAMRKLTSWDYHWCRTLILWGRAAGHKTLVSLPIQRLRDAHRISTSG